MYATRTRPSDTDSCNRRPEPRARALPSCFNPSRRSESTVFSGRTVQQPSLEVQPRTTSSDSNIPAWTPVIFARSQTSPFSNTFGAVFGCIFGVLIIAGLICCLRRPGPRPPRSIPGAGGQQSTPSTTSGSRTTETTSSASQSGVQENVHEPPEWNNMPMPAAPHGFPPPGPHPQQPPLPFHGGGLGPPGAYPMPMPMPNPGAPAMGMPHPANQPPLPHAPMGFAQGQSTQHPGHQPQASMFAPRAHAAGQPVQHAGPMNPDPRPPQPRAMMNAPTNPWAETHPQAPPATHAGPSTGAAGTQGAGEDAEGSDEEDERREPGSKGKAAVPALANAQPAWGQGGMAPMGGGAEGFAGAGAQQLPLGQGSAPQGFPPPGLGQDAGAQSAPGPPAAPGASILVNGTKRNQRGGSRARGRKR
jgi:hypothetical protein